MRFRLPRFLLQALKLSFLATMSYTVQAGIMFDSIGVEAYRDFALNVGIFEKGATNVKIYNTDGTLRGTIPVMPDFGALTDIYWGSYAATAGGQSWVLDVQHNYAPESVSFSDKYGAKDTPVMQDYRVVKHVNDVNPDYSYGDLRTTRLAKVVTDVVSLELPDVNDTFYQSVAGLGDWHLYRAGGGTQYVYDEATKELILEHSNYSYYTGGSVVWHGEVGDDNFRRNTVTHDGRSYDEDGNPIYVTLDSYYYYSEPITETDAAQSPIPIGVASGDSGSPTIIFNETTQSFQYLGGASRSPSTLGGEYTTFVSPEFHQYIIDSSAEWLNGAETSWTVGEVNADGFVTLTGDKGAQEVIRVLKQGFRGDTSTIGEVASDEEMWATLDWILDNGNATLTFTSTLDTGAGTLQFRRAADTTASNIAKYTLSVVAGEEEEPAPILNTGGYIIQEHVEVTTTLTGRAGDEWRIVGENARMKDGLYDIYGGSFTIQGTGNNEANLNLGVGVSVFLDREGGYAANDVQINTGAKVYLVRDNQINNLIAFGNDGGTLHLNGFDLNRSTDTLYALDRDARIVNVMPDTTSQLTYNFSEDDSLKISFMDGSALATANSAVLDLSFVAKDASSSLLLSNTIHTAGELRVQGGKLTIEGYQVPHAATPSLGRTEDDIYTYYEDDWAGVTVDVASVHVSDEAQLHLSSYSTTTTAQMQVDAGSSLDVHEHATLKADVQLQGEGTFHLGSAYDGHITVKSGALLTTDTTFTQTVIVPPAEEGGESTSLTSPQALDLTVEAGGETRFLRDMYLTGTSSNAGSMSAYGDLRLEDGFTNSGTLNLYGTLTLTTSFENTGTLNFESSMKIDFNSLTGVYDEFDNSTTYTIFTGSSSDSFAALTGSNTLLEGSDSLFWSFSADGTVVASSLFRLLEYSAGSTLHLAENVGGFVSGTYVSRAAINFNTLDTILNITQSGLSSERILVEGVKLSIQSSDDYQLSVDRFFMESGSTLQLTGDVLSSGTNITLTEGASDTKIILDMQGGNFTGKSWLLGYEESLELIDGVYNWGEVPFALRELTLDAESQLIIGMPASVGTLETIDTHLKGSGTLTVNHSELLDFKQIGDFSGTIEATAATIHFHQATGASIDLAEQSSLYLMGAGNYTGTLSGAGKIYVQQDQSVVTDLTDFSGTLYQQGKTLSIGGVSTEMTRLSLLGTTSLTILADSHIKTSDIYVRGVSNSVYSVAAGSHLEERGVQIGLSSGTLTFTGGGTISIEGLSLSYGNYAGKAYIDAGTTLNITGEASTSRDDRYKGVADFQLSAWNHHNELHIAGTLISNAAISNYNGTASIYITDGGTLELKKGAQYDSATFGGKHIGIFAQSGSRLVLGNQRDTTTDFNSASRASRLSVTLESGSTLAASGTGTITVPNSLIWSDAGSYTIETASGQDLYLMTGVLADQLSMTGSGQTRMNQLDTRALTIGDDATVVLTQDELAMESLQLGGVLQLSGSSIDLGAVTGAGNLQAETSTGSIHLDSISGFSGHVRIGSAALSVGAGTSAATLELGSGSQVELAADVQWSNSARATTRSGSSYSFTMGSGARLQESQMSYNLASGATLALSGEGRYEAHALALNAAELSMGASTQAQFSSLNLTSAQVNLGAGAQLSIAGESSVQSGTSRIEGQAGATLQLEGLNLAQGADLTLSGAMSLSVSSTVFVAQGASLTLVEGMTSTANFNVAGSFTADQSVGLTGHITASALNTEGSNLLDFSAGGLFTADITVEAGTASFGGTISLTGQLTNSGVMNFDGTLALSESIINSGTLNFGSILLDVSNLSSATDGLVTSYQIFTGGSSESFALLNTANIMGDWGDDVIWKFHQDGRLTSTTIESPLRFSGTEIHLSDGVGGFEDAGVFADGRAIDFVGEDMTVVLSAAGLRSERWLVSQGDLRLESNGHQVSTEKFLLGEGTSLSIVGNALSDIARVALAEGATDAHILINMQGADFVGKNWLMDFSGAVTLSQGSYDFGEHVLTHSLNIDRGATASIDVDGEWSFALTGAGTLLAEGTGVSRLAELSGFSGSLVSHASELSLGSYSSARINMIAGGKLIFEKSGFYNSLIQGASHVVAASTASFIELNFANGYSGILENHARTLIISGTHNLSRFDWEVAGGTLILEANANISNAHAGVRDIAGMTLQFGTKAQLNEQQMLVRITEGTAGITGAGTYRVGGMAFSMKNQSTFTLAAGSTLHLVGEQLTPGVGATSGSFQLSGGNYTSTLNIAGTLISEAGISNGYGSGSINVQSGGILELRQGAVYSSLSEGFSSLNIASGGLLRLGNQLDTVDYGDSSRASYLSINMASGSTLTASGTGMSTSSTSMNWAEGGSFTLRADEDQHFVINSAITQGHFDIVGAGIVQLNDVASDSITVRSGATLNFHDADTSMESIHVDGGTLALTVAQQGDYAITGTTASTLRIAAGSEEQVKLTNLAGFLGQISIAANGYLHLDSALSASSKLSMESNAHFELAANRSLSNTDQSTRTGNYTINVGANASLAEHSVSYNLQSGNTLSVSGTGAYSARSSNLSGGSLLIAEGSTTIRESSTSQGESRIELSQGASLNYSQGLDVSGGSLTIELAENTSLQGQSVSVASGAALHLTGQGSLSTTDSLNIQGTMSTSSAITLGGDIVLSGADAYFDMTAGATLTGSLTLQGGQASFGSLITFSEQITSSAAASLNFSDDIRIDISNLTASTGADTLTYTFFTGGSSASFAALGTQHIVGGNSADYDWVFDASGTMTGTLYSDVLTLTGGEILLGVGADGFEYGKEYFNNAKLNIRDVDSTLILNQDGLSVERLLVEGVQLDIQSNGHQLGAQNIILDQDAELHLLGAALSADSRVHEAQGVTQSHVVLNMDGGALAAQGWFTDYTGTVELQNGSYQLSTMGHESTQINADAALNVGDIGNITLALKGDGTISSTSTDSVTFSDLTEFSGRLDAVASAIYLQSSTAAQIAVAGGSTLHLSAGSTYSGVVSGAGVIQGVASGTASVTQLSDYRGTVNVGSGILELGGNSTSIASMSFNNGSQLNVLDHTQLSTNTSGTRSAHFTLSLGEGSVLKENSLILRPHSGTITIQGSGTYEVKGLSLSAENNQSNIHIQKDATLHITGTTHHETGNGLGSFQLSSWGYSSEVTVEGTLISDSGLSNRDGRGYITVKDGGNLILNRGGQYITNTKFNDSYINIDQGGTLTLANQVYYAVGSYKFDASTDYGVDPQAKLIMSLADGANIAGYGTGQVTIYQTLLTTEGSTINILSQEGQDLHLTKNLGDITAVVKGSGRVSIYQTEETKNFTVESADLNFQQTQVSLESLRVKGDAFLSMGADATARTRSVVSGTGELQTAELSMTHEEADSQLLFDDSVQSLSIGDATSAVTLQNKGDMRLDARNEAFEMSMTMEEFRNVTMENASISSDAGLSLNETLIVNSDFNQVNIDSVNGNNLIEGGSVGEDASFVMGALGNIRFSGTHFSSANASTLQLESGVSLSLQDIVTLDNVSASAAIDPVAESITLNGTALDLYRIDGLVHLLDKATIENQFFVDLTGIDLADLEAGGAYGFVLTDITQAYSNIVFRIAGEEVALANQGFHEGELAYFTVVIPEPSTATLSLLSLMGLLLRRRRRAS